MRLILFQLLVPLFYLSLLSHEAASAWSLSSSTTKSIVKKNVIENIQTVTTTTKTTTTKNQNQNQNQQEHPRRRDILLAAPLAFVATAYSAGTVPQPANAFENAIPEAEKYADKPKRRGTPPKDLGLLTRKTEGELETIKKPGLRICNGDPNCFSTTGDFVLEDRQQIGIDWLIAPWKPSAADAKDPFPTLAAVVKSYEPGQSGIDGAGFSIIKETDHYLYCQFESLKKGYIDDLEFAYVPPSQKDGTDGIMVRSASRVGYTDFGVNAIRLNYIASKLRKEHGWTINEITEDSHRDYWNVANDARAATFDPDRRKLT